MQVVRLRYVPAALAALLIFVPSATAAKRVRITAKAPAWIVAGDHVNITGSVIPHPPDLTLTLQRKRRKSWIVAGQGAAGADGSYSFFARSPGRGVAVYRVVAPKLSNYIGRSKRIRVRILHWAYVDRIDAFKRAKPKNGDLLKGPATVSGVHFRHSVGLVPRCYKGRGGRAWVDYAIKRRYKMFTATVGLGRAAKAGTTASYAVVGGSGKALARGTVAYGAPPQQIEISVRRLYRLRLRVDIPRKTNPGPCKRAYPRVIFGAPELLGP
jgi:hypothetical protein